MVYSEKFVFVVLVNGEPQDALANGELHLPFGQEFALRFRNKNNRRAVVKFTIDGEENVCAPNGFIIEANDFIDIKRHYTRDAAFVLADLESPAAMDAGKNGPNHGKVKGTIVAHFWLEKEQEKPPVVKEIHHHHDHYRPYPVPYPAPPRYPFWYERSATFDGTYRPTTTYNSTAETSGAQGPQSPSYGAQSDDLAQFKKVALPPNDQKKYKSRSVLRGRGPSGQSSNMVGLTGFAGTERLEVKGEATMDFMDCEMERGIASSDVRDACITEGKETGQKFGDKVYIQLETTCVRLQIHLKGHDGKVETKPARATPSPYRKGHEPKQDSRLTALEEENLRLREELAKQENEALKAKLKPKAKRNGSRKRPSNASKLRSGEV